LTTFDSAKGPSVDVEVEAVREHVGEVSIRDPEDTRDLHHADVLHIEAGH
jgi:hypothetical protein